VFYHWKRDILKRLDLDGDQPECYKYKWKKKRGCIIGKEEKETLECWQLIKEEEFNALKQYKNFLQAKFAGSYFLFSLYYILLY
jgi:hypothetical protein